MIQHSCVSRPRRWELREAKCALIVVLVSLVGCRSSQFARVIQPGEREMIGSHRAGQETFDPLVDEAVAKLLARHETQSHVRLHGVPSASDGVEMLPAPAKRICFIGVENRTAEELADFKEQIYEMIDGRILQSTAFDTVSRRYVDAGIRSARLRPDELFIPGNLRTFSQLMEQQGQPFDYLLFAKITSGTTQQNRDYQRDYQLTLELVDVHTGAPDKEFATLSKGYHHSRLSRMASKFWPKH